MVKVGLSEQEMYDILDEELRNWRIASEENLKRAIVKAVSANNEKVAEDVKKVVSSVFQTI
jgi:hypothetical protein